MQVTAQWVNGVCFLGQTESGHSIVLDGAIEGGGQNRGARPLELLLLGTLGCSSYDVVTILQKQRQKIVDCYATATAKRADTIPKVFTDIHLHFVVIGQDLSETSVAKAVELSAQKYCSASIMLSKAVNITHSFEVKEPENNK
ncbi:OsmC family protein [Neisseria sp. Ec49-e6-T10]|uniref:OsmC family protein n=1 Tax=Neisseria sp. Ec49-e6-T10 TaxID=3140744 RepID=UPI003EBD6ECC